MEKPRVRVYTDYNSHGFFRAYHDAVFRRFWNHELDIDVISEMSSLVADLGGSASAFESYVSGPAREEHDRIIAEAESLGVFGVPTMVFNGELFWGGDRIPMLIERVRSLETAEVAFGRTRRQAADLPS